MKDNTLSTEPTHPARRVIDRMAAGGTRFAVRRIALPPGVQDFSK